jgi:phage-related protein
MEILSQKFLITATKKVYKSFRELPEQVQERLGILLRQLAAQGPVAHNWPNYSKLGHNRYHCHLKYSYVACWTCDGNSIKIEVYYVGSREKAPY